MLVDADAQGKGRRVGEGKTNQDRRQQPYSASCGYKPSAKATNKVLGNDALTRSVGREHFHKPSCARARSENTVCARVLFLPMTLLGRPAKEIEIATRQFKHFGYEGLMRCFRSAFLFGQNWQVKEYVIPLVGQNRKV